MIVGAGAGEGTSGVSVRGGGRVRGNSEMTYDASGTSEVGSFGGSFPTVRATARRDWTGTQGEPGYVTETAGDPK